jgi:bla regulator protein BlaR1
MNTLFPLLAHPLAEAIGWTLLHSLWQGSVVVLLAKLALHCIPANRPNVRYAVALSGLALIVLCSAATLVISLPEQQTIRPSAPYYVAVTSPTVESSASTTFIREAARFVERQMPAILTLWMTGVLLFTLRLVVGWAYIMRLRATAVEVPEPWRALLEDIKQQFGIRTKIKLAESSRIAVPAVVGFFRPVILVPVGIFTGLSQQQVEAVLLHELSHIRRHDFLINSLQSVLEVLYFFNPFVWMLSSTARDEREYCCDDQVVNRYHPRTYAEALTYLETARLNKPALAVSLTGERNNLLYRIQRFMEQSKRNNPVPQWMVPVILAVAGVISMSWLTIGKDPAQDEAARRARIQVAQLVGPVIAPTDTIGKPTEKRAVWKRKKSVTIGEDGQPHEEIVESFEGDEELREAMKHNFNLNFDYDWDFDLNLDSGAFTWEPDSDFAYSFRFDFDSLMGPHTFYFNPMIDTMPPFRDDIKAFRQEFEKMFQDRFSDFYKKHSEDLQRMMDRLQERFNDDSWHENLERQMKEMERQMEQLMERMKESKLLDETRMHEETLRSHEMHVQNLNKMNNANTLQFRQHHDQLLAAHKQMELANRQMHTLMKKHRALQDALRDELVKDGYLDKDEPLHSIRWSNDDMEVNGKKVKPKDAKKYKKLNDKFLAE